MSNPFLEKLAKEWLVKLEGQVAAALIPPQARLVAGIAALIADEFLPELKAKKRAADFDGADLGLLQAGVAAFQNSVRGLLKVDGLLAGRTLQALLRQGKCPHERLSPKLAGEVTEPFDSREVRYFFESGLPTVQGADALELFLAAWDAWSSFADIRHRMAVTKGGANVLVQISSHVETGRGELADAHTGPPGQRQLQLRYDVTEVWDKAKFFGATCHEVGHLLGLPHTRTPSQLMNPILSPSVIVPQQEDRERVIRIWGKAPGPLPPPIALPPGPFPV